jgi:hypothetical protein
VKKLLKIAGLGFAGLFVGLMVLGFLIQVVDPEGVKRRAEERKNRKPAKKASVADQPGFTMGPVQSTVVGFHFRLPTPIRNVLHGHREAGSL